MAGERIYNHITMKRHPKLKVSAFVFGYLQHEYSVSFYPTNDKKVFRVEIEQLPNSIILEYKEINTLVNKTAALKFLSDALVLNIVQKKPGNINDRIIKFKATNSICPTAVEKSHLGLQKDIGGILARYSKKWSHLKRFEPNYNYDGKDEFNMDGDEYTAIVCAGIYKNAPFADRIEFLSSFLARTPPQIKMLLFYHFRRYNAFMDDDYYQEIFVEFETHISLYFTKFYQPNYNYGH